MAKNDSRLCVRSFYPGNLAFLLHLGFALGFALFAAFVVAAAAAANISWSFGSSVLISISFIPLHVYRFLSIFMGLRSHSGGIGKAIGFFNDQ